MRGCRMEGLGPCAYTAGLAHAVNGALTANSHALTELVACICLACVLRVPCVRLAASSTFRLSLNPEP